MNPSFDGGMWDDVIRAGLRLVWDDEDEDEIEELEYTDRVIIYRNETIH